MKAKEVLIIGGGLGGLSAAISMAAKGFSVKLFEKNDHLGGKLNEVEIEGFKFDLGPSILTMPHIFEKLFTMHDRKMEDYIKIKRMELEWKCFFEDNTDFDLFAKPEKFVAENDVLGENDLKDLKKYLNYSRQLGELVEKGYFAEGFDNLREVIKSHGIIKSWKGFDYFSTMADGVERYLSNEYLQHIFNFFIKYVGSSPYKAPAILNLLPYIQLWYVPGGLYNIAEGLEKLMKEINIEINTGTEIVKIETKNDQVKGVVLDNGQQVNGDIIISNMEVIPAYRNLTEKNEIVDKYQQKFEPACSGYVLHLGVDREYEQLEHHNFFFSQNPKKHFQSVFEDYILPDDPTIYLVAVSRTDSQQAPQGCENLKILPHIPHLGKNNYTEKDYQLLRERVLTKLERMGLKDLRSHIIVEDEWYPEDIESKYYSNHGSIYGVVSDRQKNKGFKAPKKSELFSNLYFVGGSVNPGGGMPMVVLSGQQVQKMIN